MKQNGMIAFFDILGYQNIIINNDIETVANIINDTILELPSIVKSKSLDIFARFSEKIENKGASCKTLKNAVLSFRPAGEIFVFIT